MSRQTSKKSYCFPTNVPQNSIGTSNDKMSLKVVIRKDHLRADGTHALYLQIFLNKQRKRLPLNIFVALKDFDESKQRVRKRCANATDINILIEKCISELQAIELSYRLASRPLNMSAILVEYGNPSSDIDFLRFYEIELEKEKLVVANSTYVQQRAVLRKLKRWRGTIFFHEITEQLIEEMTSYFQRVEKNKHNTISTLTKNFKKYLARANKQGIYSPVHYSEVKHRQMRGTINFLTAEEVNRIYQYYKSPFINESHKIAASKFLFSCFTGIRISDIMDLDESKIQLNILKFTAVKTKKIQNIRLNKTAKELIDDGYIFYGMSKQKIREHVKGIAYVADIKKHVNYHMSRHSFATNFLMQGGRVEVLQKLLGHATLNQTMIYVHVVDEVLNEQILLLDNLIGPTE